MMWIQRMHNMLVGEDCLPQSDWYRIASPVIWHSFERKHFGFKSVWAIEFDDKDSGYPSTTISEV